MAASSKNALTLISQETMALSSAVWSQEQMRRAKAEQTKYMEQWTKCRA